MINCKIYLRIVHTTINVPNKHVSGSIISFLTQLKQLIKAGIHFNKSFVNGSNVAVDKEKNKESSENDLLHFVNSLPKPQ